MAEPTEKKASTAILTNWDHYFMLHAYVNSLRSKNVEDRRGACLVRKKMETKDRIISNGYNGRPYYPEIHQNPSPEYTAIENVFFFYTTFSQPGKEYELYTTHFPTPHEIEIISRYKVEKVIYAIDPPDKVQIENVNKNLTFRKLPMDFNLNVIDENTFSVTIKSSDLNIQPINFNNEKKTNFRFNCEEQSIVSKGSDNFFMMHAYISSLKSKLENQRGACLVSQSRGEKKIIGHGYNGRPHHPDVERFKPAKSTYENYCKKRTAIENVFLFSNRECEKEDHLQLYSTHFPTPEEIDLIAGKENVETVFYANDEGVSDTEREGSTFIKINFSFDSKFIDENTFSMTIELPQPQQEVHP